MIQTCKNCKTEIIDSSLYCNVCEFPIGAGEKEQAKFIADQILKKGDVEESIEKLKKARIILIVVGVYNIIVPFLPIFKNITTEQIVASVIIGIVSIVFGLLTFKTPKIALLIPLIVICSYYLLLIAFDFYSFYRGIIWKVFIVSGLIYAYLGVRKSDRILKENEFLASKLGFNRIQNK